MLRNIRHNIATHELHENKCNFKVWYDGIVCVDCCRTSLRQVELLLSGCWCNLCASLICTILGMIEQSPFYSFVNNFNA